MQLVSLKTVLLKIIRDLGLGENAIPWQDMLEWCAEGLQHIGAYSQYTEKWATLPIRNFTAKLPADFYRACSTSTAFRVVGDGVQVGFREGELAFKYLAIPLDDENYPLVPDTIAYSTALFWKVAMQLSIRDELRNKSLTFPICKQRWDWYCRQAGSGFSAQTAATYAQHWLATIPAVSQPQLNFPLLD